MISKHGDNGSKNGCARILPEWQERLVLKTSISSAPMRVTCTLKNRTETAFSPRVDRSLLDTWFGKLEHTGLMSGETFDVSAAFLSGMPTGQVGSHPSSIMWPTVSWIGSTWSQVDAACSCAELLKNKLLRVHVGFFDQPLFANDTSDHSHYHWTHIVKTNTTNTQLSECLARIQITTRTVERHVLRPRILFETQKSRRMVPLVLSVLILVTSRTVDAEVPSAWFHLCFDGSPCQSALAKLEVHRCTREQILERTPYPPKTGE